MLNLLLAPQRRTLLEKALHSSGLEEQFYKGVVDEIEAFWSTERLLAFKTRCALSRRLMYTASLTLGSLYDAATDEYTEMVFKNGVSFPSLLKHGTTHQLDALSKTIYGELEPIEQLDGKRVDISVLNMVEYYLSSDPKSYLYNPEIVRCVLAADAAGLFRNVSHVNVGITLLPGRASSFVSQAERDTVTKVHTVCTFEGSDKLQDLVDASQARLTPELKQLHDHGINIKIKKGSDIQDNHVEYQLMMAGV